MLLIYTHTTDMIDSNYQFQFHTYNISVTVALCLDRR